MFFRVDGLPLVGTTVRIDAANAKLVGERGPEFGCPTILHPLPVSTWSVVSAPPGSAQRLASAETLTPALTLDRPGEYQIRLTACPSGCTIRVGGIDQQIDAHSVELVLTALVSLIVPPETEAALPDFGAVDSATRPADLRPTDPTPIPQAERNVACAGGGGIQDPQWVTAREWSGPIDYVTGEGAVFKSRVSREDSFLNHDSNDP